MTDKLREGFSIVVKARGPIARGEGHIHDHSLKVERFFWLLR